MICYKYYVYWVSKRKNGCIPIYEANINRAVKYFYKHGKKEHSLPLTAVVKYIRLENEYYKIAWRIEI